jgi:hypothetical protein
MTNQHMSEMHRRSPKKPASAWVRISEIVTYPWGTYEVAERPWGWLMTDARVDNSTFVGRRGEI